MAGRESAVRSALETPDECVRAVDRDGQTLTVWFADRSQEHVCEETGDEVILMKDIKGRVIGFEKLGFSAPDSNPLRIAVETTPA